MDQPGGAVKFVDGSDDVVEGLILPWGGPYKGLDLTGTAFVKGVTDFCLPWFPDGGRPGLYRHGFDPALKASVVGREVGGYDDDKGHWLKAQLDKSAAYWSEVKALVDAGKLFMSSGAVDHLVDVAPDGTIKMWPWVEWSLVPNPANPDQPPVKEYAEGRGRYAVKSADAIEHLRVVGTPAPDALLRIAVKGWLPEGTTQGDLDDGDFAWLSTAYKKGTQSKTDGRKYPYKVHGKVNEDGWRAAWAYIAKADPDSFAGGPSKAATIGKLLSDKPKDIDVAKKDADDGMSLYDASDGANTLANLFYLLQNEQDETLQAAMLRTCIAALIKWITAEAAEPADTNPAGVQNAAFLSLDRLAVKAGARNSASDLKLIQQAHDASHDAHDALTALGATCPMPPMMPDSSGKSADVEPVSVLAVKAGDQPVPMSGDELERLADAIGNRGLRAVKEALHIYD